MSTISERLEENWTRIAAIASLGPRDKPRVLAKVELIANHPAGRVCLTNAQTAKLRRKAGVQVRRLEITLDRLQIEGPIRVELARIRSLYSSYREARLVWSGKRTGNTAQSRGDKQLVLLSAQAAHELLMDAGMRPRGDPWAELTSLLFHVATGREAKDVDRACATFRKSLCV
jgi:hypothetical protein